MSASRTYPRTPRYRRAEELLRDGQARLATAAPDRAQLVVDLDGRQVTCTWTTGDGYACDCGQPGRRCSHVAALRVVLLGLRGTDTHPIEPKAAS